MSTGQGIGTFMSGLAGGFNVANQFARDAEKEKLDKLLKEKLASTPADATPAASPGETTPAAPSPAPTTPTAMTSGATPGSPLKTVDPVASDLAPHQRAFLNAISDGESAGKYNVRYTPKGGVEFADLSKHPGIMEKGPAGPSSAAGRYQFTKTTWDAMGGGDFSPENQDRRAWQLAVSDYAKRTGRNLDEDLQKGGLTKDMLRALTPTWTSFGNDSDKHIGAFNQSLSRYSSATPKSVSSASTPSSKKSASALDIMGEIFPESRSVLS